MAGSQRQHVATHGIEFLRRHFHEVDAARFEELDLPRRHQRRVDHRKIMVERRKAGHQVENIRAPLVVRHVEPQYLDVGTGEFAELAQALEVRAVAHPGKQRKAVDPDKVATFHLAVASDFASDREAALFQCRAVDGRFLPPLRLAHPGLHEATRSDDQRIMGIDRIKGEALRRRQLDDLSTR